MNSHDSNTTMADIQVNLSERDHAKSPWRMGIAVIVTIIVAALIGCAVGPDYRAPKTPDTHGYTATALPPKTTDAPGVGGAAQRFLSGQDIPGQWWTLFHSEAPPMQ